MRQLGSDQWAHLATLIMCALAPLRFPTASVLLSKMSLSSYTPPQTQILTVLNKAHQSTVSRFLNLLCGEDGKKWED
ncbi:hypothetical protein ACTXT7_017380 [Hymenolepis weldensis]